MEGMLVFLLLKLQDFSWKRDSIVKEKVGVFVFICINFG